MSADRQAVGQGFIRRTYSVEPIIDSNENEKNQFDCFKIQRPCKYIDIVHNVYYEQSYSEPHKTLIHKRNGNKRRIFCQKFPGSALS